MQVESASFNAYPLANQSHKQTHLAVYEMPSVTPNNLFELFQVIWHRFFKKFYFPLSRLVSVLNSGDILVFWKKWGLFLALREGTEGM